MSSSTLNGPSGRRAIARCLELGDAPYSDISGGLFRPYLGPAHLAARDRIAGWMAEAGLATAVDRLGTLTGRLEGRRPGLPALLIGSHIDSVRKAGVYDGALGVMLAIETAEILAGTAARLPFAIEVVCFGDEEGSRFPVSMLCSKAFAGALPDPLPEMRDYDGVSFRESMVAAGLDVADARLAIRDPSRFLAFLEAHIEQGPVLEADGRPLGVVAAIAGIERFEVTMEGQAGHAGTVPMDRRKDALVASAEAILAVQRIGRDHGGGLVATVGKVSVHPGGSNIIPGRAVFSVEVRSGDARQLAEAVAHIRIALGALGGKHGVKVSFQPHQTFDPVTCDPALTALLADAVRAVGLDPRVMVSGAGHDTMMLAPAIASTMLFIRCRGGISHHPLEHVEPADADAALEAMLAFVEHLRRREDR